MIKQSGQRMVVLIDVQNLYHSAKHLYNAKVNFKQVLGTAVGSRTLVRSFGYVVRTKTGEEKAFFDALTNLGIEIRIKDLQEYYGGLKKGDWDVGMVIDAVQLASSVDVITLVTGDGDFIPLVKHLQARGKKVEVMAFERSASSKLKEEVDEFINLEKNPKRYLLKK